MCLQKKKETFRHVFLTNHKYIFKKSSKETTCFLQMNSLLLNMRTEMHWNKGLLFIRSNLQLTKKLVSDLPSGQAPSFHVAVENLINRILLWLDSQKKKNRLLIWWNLISFYYFCFTFLWFCLFPSFARISSDHSQLIGGFFAPKKTQNLMSGYDRFL